MRLQLFTLKFIQYFHQINYVRFLKAPELIFMIIKNLSTIFCIEAIVSVSLLNDELISFLFIKYSVFKNTIKLVETNISN